MLLGLDSFSELKVNCSALCQQRFGLSEKFSPETQSTSGEVFGFVVVLSRCFFKRTVEFFSNNLSVVFGSLVLQNIK